MNTEREHQEHDDPTKLEMIIDRLDRIIELLTPEK